MASSAAPANRQAMLQRERSTASRRRGGRPLL